MTRNEKNLQSTKVHPDPLSDTDIFIQHNDFFPKVLPHESKPTYDCMALLIPFTAKTKGYLDLTGRFPYTSDRGNQYILIIYDYDSNCILATATKIRQTGELAQAFIDLHSTLNNRSAAPNVYILDNNFSSEMKLAMKKYTLQ